MSYCSIALFAKVNEIQVTSNVSLNAGVDILIQPNTHAGSVLKVPAQRIMKVKKEKQGYLKIRLMGCTITFCTF